MKYELPVDTHLAVGPVPQMYGHGPVTVLRKPTEDRSEENIPTVYVCLDCGFTVHDNRLLATEACDTDDNPIAQTWRSFLADEASDDALPRPDPESEWPMEHGG